MNTETPQELQKRLQLTTIKKLKAISTVQNSSYRHADRQTLRRRISE